MAIPGLGHASSRLPCQLTAEWALQPHAGWGQGGPTGGAPAGGAVCVLPAPPKLRVCARASQGSVPAVPRSCGNTVNMNAALLAHYQVAATLAQHTAT